MYRISAALLVFATPAFGATYYVSNSGVDSNPGTQAAPWRTYTKVAEAALNPGDTVYFARGETFYVNTTYGFGPTKSGTSDKPITYDAYGSGALPIISGGGTNMYAMGINGASYSTFNNLHFTAATDDAVQVWQTSNLTFDNDTFDYSAGIGINFEGSAPATCSTLVVMNSVASYNPLGGILDACPGSMVLFQSNQVFNNVTSTQSYHAGIRVVSDGTAASHRQTNVMVIDNHVYDNGIGSGGVGNNTGYGIHMDTVGTGMLVSDNDVEDNQGFGIMIEWAGTSGTHQVTGNYVANNVGIGILQYRRSWKVQVSNNTSTNNGTNYQVQGEAGGEASQQRFTASISGSTLNVTGNVNAGYLEPGQIISGAGIPANTSIEALGTGTGQAGTYTLSTKLGTLPSETMIAATRMVDNTWTGNWGYQPASGSSTLAADAGGQNDTQNGIGNTYLNNCLGANRPNIGQWGGKEYSTSASFAAATSGAASISCTSAQLK